jgi:hypothetical protein
LFESIAAKLNFNKFDKTSFNRGQRSETKKEHIIQDMMSKNPSNEFVEKMFILLREKYPEELIRGFLSFPNEVDSSTPFFTQLGLSGLYDGSFKQEKERTK